MRHPISLLFLFLRPLLMAPSKVNTFGEVDLKPSFLQRRKKWLLVGWVGLLGISSVMAQTTVDDVEISGIEPRRSFIYDATNDLSTIYIDIGTTNFDYVVGDSILFTFYKSNGQILVREGFLNDNNGNFNWDVPVPDRNTQELEHIWVGAYPDSANLVVTVDARLKDRGPITFELIIKRGQTKHRYVHWDLVNSLEENAQEHKESEEQVIVYTVDGKETFRGALSDSKQVVKRGLYIVSRKGAKGRIMMMIE